MTVLLVTGTDHGVGVTTATAAIAALAPSSVAVVKLAQTGAGPDDPGDLDTATRLVRTVEAHEFARYPDPLAPHHAAVLSGTPPLTFADTVRRLIDLDALHDLVLVDGAGGLLVPFDHDDGWTLVDLAPAAGAQIVVVTRPGHGTLNHTALTMTTIAEQTLDLAGLVIGSWPAEPDLAMRSNVADLRRLGRNGALAGVLPTGIATEPNFRRRARAALGPEFGGTFDSRRFVAHQKPW